MNERFGLDYECHITVEPPVDAQAWTLEGIKARIEEVGWSYSCIFADPVLGQKAFCYATNHYSVKTIAVIMTVTMAEVFEKLGLKVVRAKVEQIVYDTRSKP